MPENDLAPILAILNRIEGKVDNNHHDISSRLNQHMEDEEGKIEAMTESFRAWKEESRRQADSLSQSLVAYSEELNTMIGEVHNAFIRGADGKPDIEGHRTDHVTRKQFADWTGQLKKDIIATGIKAGVLALLSWAGYYLWLGFLQGPKP